MRFSRDFKQKVSIKALHCTLMGPILTVVWDPLTTSINLLLERVQRKFLRCSGFVLKIPHNKHDYTSVTNQLSISSLADRILT